MHLQYWGFKSFGMWCCVTGQVVSHILKDVAFRPSRNGLQRLVTEDYRRVYGSYKMTKRHNTTTFWALQQNLSMMPVLSGSSCKPVCQRQTLCPSPGFWHNSVPSCSTWQTCTWMSPKITVRGHDPDWMTTKLCVFTWDLDFGMKSSKSHQIHFQVIYYHLIFLLLCDVLS